MIFFSQSSPPFKGNRFSCKTRFKTYLSKEYTSTFIKKYYHYLTYFCFQSWASTQIHQTSKYHAGFAACTWLLKHIYCGVPFCLKTSSLKYADVDRHWCRISLCFKTSSHAPPTTFLLILFLSDSAIFVQHSKLSETIETIEETSAVSGFRIVKKMLLQIQICWYLHRWFTN